MGTRADFYIGRGKAAEWVGSIALDGYPDGLSETTICEALTKQEFRLAVALLIQGRRDGTTPDKGWPWPWNDSKTTDYTYAFDAGKVWASCFGREWFDPLCPEPGDGTWGDKVVEFPDMADKKNVTIGSRSGLVVFLEG